MALFTIVLPVLLGAMALGADFAIIYLNWSMVQKAADAAALAGASQLTGVVGSAAGLTNAVDNYVNGYACLNGVSDPSNTYATICPTEASHPGGVADKIVFTNVTDTQVSVGIHRTVPYSFGKMIGLNTAAVAATATAAILPPGTVPQGLFPIGLPCSSPCSDLKTLLKTLSSLSNASGGSNITLGSKFVISNLWNEDSPGNFGWLDVGQGNGAPALGNVLQNGSTETFAVGSLVSTTPGVGKGNGNPAQQGLQARLNKCTPGIADPCANGGTVPKTDSCSDPCLITVPAVDYSLCSGASCNNMAIYGFAQMYMEQDSSTTSGIDACIVTNNNCTTTGSGTAPNYGLLAPPVLIN
jgi:Flp pilus assembly protein TadG